MVLIGEGGVLGRVDGGGSRTIRRAPQNKTGMQAQGGGKVHQTVEALRSPNILFPVRLALT